MPEVFPEPIRSLPEADIPLSGLKAYLSQSDNHQILFMKFDEDVEVPEHSHEDQWGVVLEGKIDLHSAKIYTGYADISFFNEKDRYKRK
ncbi:MAG: cupin domain-containing protein [Planctomycetota bacterium]|jgi:hypothetical protein